MFAIIKPVDDLFILCYFRTKMCCARQIFAMKGECILWRRICHIDGGMSRVDKFVPWEAICALRGGNVSQKTDMCHGANLCDRRPFCLP